jgi:ABC-type cobalamin/Fe3+-siderophores transport system ATPase subunit
VRRSALVEEEGDMHLVSLEVKGLKSLRDTKVEGLGHYNVFIGKNDSGKSTVLQAVRLLQGLQGTAGGAALGEIVADRLARGVVDVSAVFVLSDEELWQIPGTGSRQGDPVLERFRRWRFEFEMRLGYPDWSQDRTYLKRCGPVQGDDFGVCCALTRLDNPRAGYRVVQSEQLVAPLADEEAPLHQVMRSQPTVQVALPSTFAQGASGPGGLPWRLLDGSVGGMAYLSPKRQAHDQLSAQQSLALAPSGENLTQVLDTLNANYPERFGAVVSLVKELFPSVAEVHLTREQQSVVLRIATQPKKDATGAFRVSEVGTGIQQALMIAASVVSTEDGGAVLLEEPENNLHPGAQRALAAWLRKQAVDNDKQLLLCTHSTIFASNDEHSSTYLVRLDQNEGTKVTRLGPGDEAAVKEELGLRNVDLYGCNMVVLCEGDSEMVAMPIILDALAPSRGTTLAALGLAWRNLGGAGSSRVRWVEEFLKLLKDIDVKPYILVDDDPAVREGLKRLVSLKALGGDEYYIWSVDKTQSERNASVTSEFEDNWTNEQLVHVAHEIAREDGVEFDVDAGRFANLCRQSQKRSSKVLEDYCWSEGRYDLDKKQLNRGLAELVAPELRGEAERTVKEYEFEKAASEIFTKLGGPK